ncbi:MULTISPECIES: helix-turn-helix domain-containing protein [Shouchella]|uniref:HTH-type transcriptional regulator n=3 Tax=Bacillaceae TaxID=186817 RepID=A0A060LWT6_9BACI|nr:MULTISPECIES: helix-turn-helix transcriptional regulator [Bacillaceae]RQW21504.1 XRE family transcriptional regulator [Bacillus sp. C1-1]AIC94647.1 HTH-type transcriptional regulator [Shouchella lehensis G1]KQL51800.1 transcriptional regulator [Alkalicoccobacillus plakortidis]MBG9784469.1 transcriptional regulator [Shouchella lehensis]TES51479.1 XRE family transcriptional regulator [Shouchella lehensis]
MAIDSKRLKQLRKEQKLTQEQLGRLINVTKVSISGYENGNRTPDTDTINRIADVFGVTTDYLFGRTDRRKPAFLYEPDLTENEEQLLREHLQTLRKNK